MKIRYLMSFLAFGVIVGLSIAYIASLGVRVRPPADRVNVSMQVPDINGLVADSNVLLRGVPVGKVTGIDTTLSGATVHFYIDKRFPIPLDSEVRLENLSALGESYIGLRPRTDQGPMFRDGQEVSTENVVQPASISELATSVVRVLNQMDTSQLNRIVNEADTALPDRDTVLPNLARASILMRNMVAGLNGRGSDLLSNSQTLLQNAGFVGPQLAQITQPVYDAALPLNQLYHAAIDGAVKYGMPQTIGTAGKFFSRTQNFLDNRGPDLKVIAEALMPYMQGIAASAMNLDTGQILTNMLDAIPEDGTITLHVATPNP